MCAIASAQAATDKASFDMLDLNHPGLEQVRREFDAENYESAADELLRYFKKKSLEKSSDSAKVVTPTPSKATIEVAENALRHHFRPHKGYGYFDYGQDIDWQMWPIKDNEVRWQLHRVKWWAAMAQVYSNTRDERYAKEWMLQFSDWSKKNPLGLSKENDTYAWRPLEVSDRVESLVATFNTFVTSPNFTPNFLLSFLQSYSEQAYYLHSNYAELGNHRLFEAQRALYAGAEFPELKKAPALRKRGIEVLSAEIMKQVYPDGVHFELSPGYHAASIDIFLNAYRAAQRTGIEKEFPDSYRKTVEKMVMAYINFTFPDYTQPMFGDSWWHEKRVQVNQFSTWLKAFPDNEALRYFASEGKDGKPPAYLSKGLNNAGFYTFRTGWHPNSTVMVVKASPPGPAGGFHAHPDNGTFELWINGRNFTPDSGAYVYSGDAEIMKLRSWYRQSRVHSTLTLDDKDMQITQSALAKWNPTSDIQTLTYTNPSYANLNHQRTILLIDNAYFLVIDRAIGKATGKLGTHFVLREDSKPAFDLRANLVHTQYSDGNNLLVKNIDEDGTWLREEDGKVSYKYREEFSRPAFVFEKAKARGKSQSFITIMLPYSGSQVPSIRATRNPGHDLDNDRLDLTLNIDGKDRRLQTQLTQ